MENREFTLRAVLTGCVIAVLLVMVNIYMGLKTGFGEGGSIIAAILGLIFFRFMLRRMNYGILENNMTQTVGSAGASIGSIVSVIPAFMLLHQEGTIGLEMNAWTIFWFVAATSMLGVFFAVPLRRQMVVVEQLRFPSGTACAEMMTAFYDKAQEAKNKLKSWVLLATAGLSGVYTLLAELGMTKGASMLTGGFAGFTLAKLTIGLAWSPLLIGAGVLIGLRTGFSMLLGAGLTFLVFGPWALNNGYIDPAEGEKTYKTICRWAVWPGVSIMVTTGLMAMAIRWRTIVNTFRSMLQVRGGQGDGELPFVHWLIGMGLASLINIVIMYWIFHVPVWLTVICIILSFVLASIAVRAMGETEINPVGSMGTVTQFIFGGLAPGNITTNLTMAGVTAGGASEAGDMMQDLRTGHLVKATPRRQVYGQIIGVLVGTAVCVPLLLMVIKVYGIGTEAMPAPAALRYAVIAKAAVTGTDSIPERALLWSAIFGALGIVLASIEATRFKKYVPSPMGIGIAMIIPFYYSSSIFLGALLAWLIGLRWKKAIKEQSFIVGSGGIVGEAVMGMCIITVVCLKEVLPEAWAKILLVFSQLLG